VRFSYGGEGRDRHDRLGSGDGDVRANRDDGAALGVVAEERRLCLAGAM
jgi:hypothetical protein